MNKTLFTTSICLFLLSSVQTFGAGRTEGWMDVDLCAALKGFIRNDSACRFFPEMSAEQRRELRQNLLAARSQVLEAAICKLSRAGTTDAYVVPTDTASFGIFAVAKRPEDENLGPSEIVNLDVGFRMDGKIPNRYYGYAGMVEKGLVKVDVDARYYGKSRTLVIPIKPGGECQTLPAR